MTLCGPRTIPFLEYHGARGTPGGRDPRRARPAPRPRATWVVLYGHPCYEGVHDGLLRRGVRRGAGARVRVRHHGAHGPAAAGHRRGVMIRVLSVFGTRPEAIKLAPVVRALARRARPVRERRLRLGAASGDARPGARRCSTSSPDHDLDLMTPGPDAGGDHRPRARAAPAAPPPGPSRRRAGPGRHDDDVRRRVRRLPRADPVGARRGGAPHRRPLPAVPGRDEPGAHHPARRRCTSRRRRRRATGCSRKACRRTTST